jgi:hypothetical protein
MKTTDFLNKFVNSLEFDAFLTYGTGYNPAFEEFSKVHFLWETYLVEIQADFIEEPTQLHYICDRVNRTIIGPYPLTVREFTYAVFVSSLLMYVDPTVELSLGYTKTILSFPHPGIDLKDEYNLFEGCVKDFTG